MKKLFKFVFIVAFVLGGWVLSAASLHIVRAPGSMLWGKVPLNLKVVTKNSLSFKDTWVDTTKWSVADIDAHSCFVDRLRQTNKLDLLPAPEAQASAVTPSLVPSTPATVTPSSPDQPKPKSIFDFSK